MEAAAVDIIPLFRAFEVTGTLFCGFSAYSLTRTATIALFAR